MSGLCTCGQPGCSDGSDLRVEHMSGPQHYAEAERLLGTIEARKLGSNETFAAIEMAQVHATLALTAATADQTAARGPGDIDPAWNPILSAGVEEAE